MSARNEELLRQLDWAVLKAEHEGFAGTAAALRNLRAEVAGGGAVASKSGSVPVAVAAVGSDASPSLEVRSDSRTSVVLPV